MKMSWGTGLVLAMLGFIGFILYFVITMSTDDKYSYDLVTEEYYKTELDFQHQLDKEKNADNLSAKITVEKTSKGLIVAFPSDLEPQNIKGKLFLYRPSNKSLDNEIPLSLSSNQLLVPDESLVGGRWNIIVDWSYIEEDYYFKKEIVY